MNFFMVHALNLTGQRTCINIKEVGLLFISHKMDVVKAVLEKHQKELDKYKPITVEKHLECRIDVGTLLITDPNDLDDRQLA